MTDNDKLREIIRNRIAYHCDERKNDYRLGKACVEPLIEDIIKDMAKNPRALTIDQLRGMNGEPVWCVDAKGRGIWALVHVRDEVCTDADFGDWEFYCYGWRDGDKLNESGWLAYKGRPEGSENG